MNIPEIFLNMSIFARVRLRRTCMCRIYVCLCKLKTPSSYPMLASLACTPSLQERDHTSELGTLIPQSTCKLGRKFENSLKRVKRGKVSWRRAHRRPTFNRPLNRRRAPLSKLFLKTCCGICS